MTSTVTEYAPPDGLAPAEILLLLGSGSWYEALGLSTLVDLAERGHVHIEDLPENERVRINSTRQRRWQIRRLVGRDALRPFETLALERIFEHGDPAFLEIDPSVLVKKVSPLTSKYVDIFAILKELKTLGYMKSQGMPWKILLSWIAVGLLIAKGVGILWSMLDSHALSITRLVLGVLVIACGFVFMSKIEKSAHLTDKGKALKQRARGFRRYIESVYGLKVDWTMRENVNEKLLGYAVAFGLGKNWHEGLSKPAPDNRQV